MSKYKDMSDEYLMGNYVPDVYQPSIYAIDYEKLKSCGIKVISFDINDTITGLENPDPPKAAITLFENLKNMGFEVVLLTNARDSRGSHFGKALGVDYIAKAEKPLTANFQKIQDNYIKQHNEGLSKNQMAHGGNILVDDVAGGKAFGLITCLVRRAGNLTAVIHKIKNRK